MIHFCDNQFHRKERNKRTVDETKLRDMRAIRRNQTYQPNMYFCVDSASLRIVCVDTGIRTHIDDDQIRSSSIPQAWVSSPISSSGGRPPPC